MENMDKILQQIDTMRQAVEELAKSLGVELEDEITEPSA